MLPAQRAAIARRVFRTGRRIAITTFCSVIPWRYPAWNTPYQTLTSISVANGSTTIFTANRGAPGSINYCPSRFTISGVQGNPSLNGIYNTTSCPDANTIILSTPDVPNWTYPNNTLPEPEIGLTSGTVTSISGYSDLGGQDSAVTLGLWETAPNQNMATRANVIAGTFYHEIGHTLGLTHGGRYYDTPGSYVPTYEANCKPNFQSTMNYLFQLDGVGPAASVAFSNQALNTLMPGSLGSVTQLTDGTRPSDVLDFVLVYIHGAQLWGERRHSALRRHAAHRRYGISHQCVDCTHPGGGCVVDWAEHHLRQHHE